MASPPPSRLAPTPASVAPARPPRRRRPSRAIPARRIARGVILVAAVDTLISLVLPWISTDRGDIAAYRLSANALALPQAQWIALAIWLAFATSIAGIVLALADARRSLGLVPAVVALAAGFAQIGTSAYLIATEAVFRQVGPIAFGLGGLVSVGGGALLARGTWEAAPASERRTGARLRTLPWVAIALVAVDVLTHVALAGRDDYHPRITRALGLIGGAPLWYTLFTSQFLHADWFHLTANAAVLVAVGAAIEIAVGRARFLGAYLLGGIAGALASVAIDPRIHVPLVGSSGAVAGVVGLCLVFAPRRRIRIWLYAVATVVRVELQAAWVFSAWIALQAVGSLYLAMGEADGVAYWGHLGGAVFGIAAGAVLRRVVARPRPAPEAVPLGDGHAAGADTARARRVRPSPYAAVPVALTGVALVISLVAAFLTNRPSTLQGELALFAHAWNSGRVERVAAHFAPEVRDEYAAALRRILQQASPGAAAGGICVRIALQRFTGGTESCAATFRATGPDADPYRASRGGTMFVSFARDRERWWAAGIALSGVSGPGAPAPGD